MKGTKCISCGNARASIYLRVYGNAPDGAPRAWICDMCDKRKPLTSASRPTPRMVGKAPIKFTTVLRAEQFVAAGFGWTADEVLRNALDMIEHSGFTRTENRL